MSNRLSYRTFAAFRRRASLLLLVAAVIAGIFGMHVVNGSHSTHASTAAATLPTAAAAHHAHGTSQHLSQTPLAEADKCTSGSCACSQAAGPTCTPSLKTGSLAASAPGDAVAADSPVRGHDEPQPSWSYQPAGPTPGQLSISRT